MSHPLPLACLNCGQAFAERPRYCPACGQATNVQPPTLREFAQQFGGSYLAAEGALWRTLKLLIVRPGALTCEYLAGRRRQYVLPLRLYLTISLFALIALQLGSQLDSSGEDNAHWHSKATEIATERKHFTVIDADSFQAGVRDGKFFCEGLPSWLCRRFERRLDVAPQTFERDLADLPQRFVEHWGKAMFVLVPLFAALLKLVYLPRKIRYTEHLVFALHVHAFCFLAIACTALPWKPVSLSAVFAMPLYAVLAARRVYAGRWWVSLLRGVTVFTLYSTALALAMVVVALWVFLD